MELWKIELQTHFQYTTFKRAAPILMNRSVINFLAILAGILVGGFTNSGIVSLGLIIIPFPGEADSLVTAMPMLTPNHFIFPFLAHALGTLVGCVVAVRIGKGHPLRLALPVSTIFFLGGSYMVHLLDSPLWFNVLDLALAYFPMAWLAGRLAARKILPTTEVD